MNITITGDLGSGKSSVSKILMAQGYDYVTVGALFRQEAINRGVTVVELNKLAETDASIDKTVDNMQRELGKIKDNTIFDSRLAFHFVPKAYSVYMHCNINESAVRIFNDNTRVSERNTSLYDTKMNIAKRRELEVSRYKTKYGVDYSDFKNYDLVVDTTFITPEQVAQLIYNGVHNNIKTAYLCPMNIYPTQPTRCLSSDRLEYYFNQLERGIELPEINVSLGEDGFLYVIDGHHRLLASLIFKRPVIRANLIEDDIDGSTASWCYDFEDIAKFKYKYYPEF